MPDIVQELRDHAEAASAEAWRRHDGGLELCMSANLASKAANEIESLRADKADYAAIVKRVWAALGIETYEHARGVADLNPLEVR